MSVTTFKYEGYLLSRLVAIAKDASSTDQEQSDVLKEVLWREWAEAYTRELPENPYGILLTGFVSSPITCSPQGGGRPKDRQPVNQDPPPRPIGAVGGGIGGIGGGSGGGSGGGGGYGWMPLPNGDYQLVPQ